ncbi:MAG TPA: hypothetical protein VFK43_03305, partial [Acidimicrobiales bacterium]|nr:hypothetical protein [Acidimicrobiales bacterium]
MGVMAAEELDRLDPAGVLAAAEQTLYARRAAEVDDLRLLAHWAVLHNADTDRPECRDPAAKYGARPARLGGEGTPQVWDHTIAELAVARRVHPIACEKAVADVLDLQHRLPRVWAQVQALAGEPWVARRVATLTRPLPADTVATVDAAVAAALPGEPPSRVLAIAEAAVIAADPAAHQARVEAARRRRHVALTRCDETGLRTVIARVCAGDATWVDAMVDRVADILHHRHPHRQLNHHDHHGITRDELRAEAFGWLARPAELLQLLLTADHPPTHPPTHP